MQYVKTIQEKSLAQQDLIFFIFSAREILGLPGVYTTDGNAASSGTRILAGKRAIPYVDWDMIDSRRAFWGEWKRKKMAEVLVPDLIDRTYIKSVVVYSEAARHLLEQLTTLALQAMPPHTSLAPIQVNSCLYFRELGGLS